MSPSIPAARYLRTCNVCGERWLVTRRQARAAPAKPRRPRRVSAARHGGRSFDFSESARAFTATLEALSAYRRCPRCGVDDFSQRGAWRAARIAGTLVATLLALVLSGCAASHSPVSLSALQHNATLSQPKGTPIHGGTVAWAQGPGDTPNYIFPVVSEADFSNANSEEFSQLLFRPLYWYGSDGKPTVDFDKSVGRPPVYSDHDRVATVHLNHYRWSDGETVDARDVILFMHLVTVEKENYGGYVPGYFPDNIRSTTAPDGPTGTVVRFDMTKPVNPTWFLYNELSQVTPLPIAWDRTSLHAAAPAPSAPHLPDTTVAGTRAVYKFLNAQSEQLTTYATSPLWSIVDGPWRLAGFSSDGESTFVPNPRYVGPDHPYLSKFVEVPFTSDTAEFDTLASGNHSLQVGYIPPEDAPRTGSIERHGYRSIVQYPFGQNSITLNFTNPKVGPLFRQLYIRQAMEHLIDQSGWSKSYFDTLATPMYGPVPTQPANPFADRFERTNPYPFDPAAAQRLLAAHGWAVHPEGLTTCAQPSRCGAGIHRGEPLRFNMIVANGSVANDSAMDDFVADAAVAGIHFSIALQPINTVYAEQLPTSRSWEIAEDGAGDSWVFGPDYYASGEELYGTGATNNDGAYSSKVADRLIEATTSVGAHDSQRALNAYENFIERQLPDLGAPEEANELVVASNLGGAALAPNVFYNLDPESWYYVRR